MPTVKCKICKKPFYAKPSWIKVGYGKFCSKKCHHETLKTGRTVNCFICHKPVYKAKKALNGSRSKKYFCNKSCQTIWRNSIVYVGKNHPNWKEGKFISYRNILIKNGGRETCTICNINDRRVLAAHHVDGNHKNNDLKNLTWLCYNCHFLVHNHKKEQDKLKNILKKEVCRVASIV